MLAASCLLSLILDFSSSDFLLADISSVCDRSSKGQGIHIRIVLRIHCTFDLRDKLGCKYICDFSGSRTNLEGKYIFDLECRRSDRMDIGRMRILASRILQNIRTACSRV